MELARFTIDVPKHAFDRLREGAGRVAGGIAVDEKK